MAILSVTSTVAASPNAPLGYVSHVSGTQSIDSALGNIVPFPCLGTLLLIVWEGLDIGADLIQLDKILGHSQDMCCTALNL